LNSTCAAGAGFRLQPLKSTCAAEEDLGAIIEVDLCRWSRLQVVIIKINLCHRSGP
jgi:hypothetical protein